MGNLTILNIDDFLHVRLKDRARKNGRSVEDEARTILSAALEADPKAPGGLGNAIHALFEPLGGADLALPPREPVRDPPRFDP